MAEEFAELQLENQKLKAELVTARMHAEALQSQLTAADKRIVAYVEESRKVRGETARIRAELRWLLQDAGALRNRFEQLVGRAERLEADNALARNANEASAEALQAASPAAVGQPPADASAT
jgi:predicted nuclease with TOPRIM domain